MSDLYNSYKVMKINEDGNLLNIKTNESNEIVISARELHEGLKIKTQYTKWFERMSEYGFEENVDYIAISQKRLTAQGNETTYTDHILKLDMAKELCMLQRNEKGKQYRKYLLEVEKDWNSPEKVMARALVLARNTINSLDKQIEEMKPKAIFADAVASSKGTILIRELAKLLKQNGIDTGEKRLYEWLRNNGYLIKQRGADYNTPTQKAMDMKLFEIKETSMTHSNGSVMISKTTKVTGKGQVYFINKFKNN